MAESGQAMARLEAESDPDWPELVEFLAVAGLKDGVLERALVQLATEGT